MAYTCKPSNDRTVRRPTVVARLLVGLLATAALLLAACGSNAAESTAPTPPEELGMVTTDTDSGSENSDGSGGADAPVNEQPSVSGPDETADDPETPDSSSGEGSSSEPANSTDTNAGLDLVIPTPTPLSDATAPATPAPTPSASSVSPTTTPTTAPTATPTAPPATPTPTPTTKTCTTPAGFGASFTATYPSDWFTATGAHECTMFSPAPINLPQEAEYAMEISFWVDPRPYEYASGDIILDPYAYWGGGVMIGQSGTATVDGYNAMTFYDEFGVNAQLGGNYTAYAVDLEFGTLLAVAREITDGSGAAPNLVNASATLDYIMSNIDLNPITDSGCNAPLPTGTPVITTDIDLNGNYQLDTISVYDDPADPNGGILVVSRDNGTQLTRPVFYDPQSLIKQLRFTQIAPNAGSSQIITTLSTNPSGDFSELWYVADCEILPANASQHGSPTLSMHSSVSNAHSWGCVPGPTGGLNLLVESAIVNVDGGFDTTYSIWMISQAPGSPMWTRAAHETSIGEPSPSHPNAPTMVPCNV